MKIHIMLIALVSILLSGYAEPPVRQFNPHGNLDINCNQCHSPKRWKPTKRIIDFDHGKSGFPLSGSHKALLCTECHKDLKFQTISSSCADCHKDIHKGKFGFDCQACHSTKKWSSEFLTSEAQAHIKFPLVGFHSMDGTHSINECTACHKNQAPKDYANTPTECRSCHMADYDKVPIHKNQNYSTDCASCHTSALISGWKNGTTSMTHPATLPLTGAHGKISCYDCHKKDTFAGLNPNCTSCHQADFDKTTKPNHRDLAFPTDCASCHTNENWTAALIPSGTQFKHPAAFPLTGGHAKPKCVDCHAKGYVGTAPECISCHETDFTKTTSPNHADQKFSKDCAQCHNSTQWKGAVIPAGTDFKHSETFPLTGGHAKPKCVDCHAQGYTGTKPECVGCHEKDFTGTTNPNHIDQKFSKDCAQCHNSGEWKGAMIPPGANFQHPVTFPLKGGHAVPSCVDCHKDGKYTNTPTDCFSCHQTNYDTTRSPNHLDLKFGTNCTECHNVNTWQGVVIPAGHAFEHPATFPLKGGHDQVDCLKCHAQGYSNTPTECTSCHDKDFKLTTAPNHLELKFSTNCAECHTVTKDWKGALIPANSSFQHPATFPLAGGHKDVSCSGCHTNGYANTPTDCLACHDKDFNATTSPNHKDLNFSTNCAQCHKVDTWKGATVDPGNPSFQHPGTFPLVAGHANVSCMECHAGGYTNTSPVCNTCHNDDYVKAVPNHATLNLPTDCVLCHTNVTWTGANIPPNITINHPAAFPLTSPHNKAACVDCHSKGYTKTASDCYSCHQTDYTAAMPNHVTLNLPKDCKLCHTNGTWMGATIPANITIVHPAAFPLTLPHDKAACVQCHSKGYSKTASDCYSCHQTDFANAKSPDHAASGFSTDCLSCHKKTTWSGATFDHSKYFPIATGRHSGFQCTECHTVPGNNKAFECILCHAHNNKAQVDGEHNGERNYRYTSEGCYSCHPRGNGD